MLFTILTAFFLSPSPVQAQNFEGFRTDIQAFSAPVQAAWDASVAIEAKEYRDSMRRQFIKGWHGTGFIVNVNIDANTILLATNKHLGNCESSAFCEFVVRLETSQGKKYSWRAKIIKSYEELDLSFLEISKVDKNEIANFKALHLREDAKTFSPANDIFAIGHPETRLRKHWQRASALRGIKKAISQGLSVKNFSMREEYYPGSLPLEQRSSQSPLIYLSNSTWAFSADILPGNSGGPVVDHDGNVIAMVGNIARTTAPNLDGLPYCFVDASTSLQDLGCFYTGASAELIAAKFKEVLSPKN